MNKNLIPLLLIIIAIGTYFSFTRAKIEELESIRTVNDKYKEAIENFKVVAQKRDDLINQYNSLNAEDRDKLDKLLPENVDSVRLIIDVNGIAARHSLSLKDVKTETESNLSNQNNLGGIEIMNSTPDYNTVNLSFKVKGSYQNFVSFLEDVEKSLRIIDVSTINLTTGLDANSYDYEVEIKTYWLKEIK